MHDALAVNVFQRFANSLSNADCAFDRHLFLLDQNLPQQLPFHPLHDHVNAAAVVIRVHSHDAGMVELLPDFFFTLEAVVKKRIGFDFRMGNFDGYGTLVLEVGGLVDGGHSAPGDEIFQAVMVEFVAGME